MSLNPGEYADQILPADLRDPERVLLAAGTVAELVRRLNLATRGTALPDPPTVDELVALLANTVDRLAQLLQQISARLDSLSTEPTLAVDGMTPGVTGKPVTADTPAEVASCAAHFLDDAAQQLGQPGRLLGHRPVGVIGALGNAHRCTARLYLRDEEL